MSGQMRKNLNDSRQLSVKIVMDGDMPVFAYDFLPKRTDQRRKTGGQLPAGCPSGL